MHQTLLKLIRLPSFIRYKKRDGKSPSEIRDDIKNRDIRRA